MATKRSQPRSLYGTAKAHGDAQTQEARQPLAQARQGEGPPRAEVAEGAVVGDPIDAACLGVLNTERADYIRTDAALKRLVTEPGETWVLETDQAEAIAMAALGTWSAARGVFVLVFGQGERFTCLTTRPGDTIVIHTDHVENLNTEALGQWAGSRGLALAVLPSTITLEQVNDATLDQMGLMRKPQGLIIPGPGQIVGNGNPR